MKKYYLIVLFVAIVMDGIAQAPGFAWAKSAGNEGDEEALSVTTDISGNVYVTGYFNSLSIVFDTTTLMNNSGLSDMYIVKYDPNGNVLWAKSSGSGGNDYGNSVAVDATGNVYVTGSFEDSQITFGPYTFSNTDPSGYYCDLFIVKYDANGNVLWAKTGGGENDVDVGCSVITDTLGNVYLTGGFTSTIAFDSIVLTSVNIVHGYDVFLTKYDSAGNVIWAKSAGGAGVSDYANSITIDGMGNILITGGFTGPTITFDFITLTNVNGLSNLERDIFIAKYDTNGNVLWAKSAGGPLSEAGVSISADVLGNVFVTGYLQSASVTFDTCVLANTGSVSIFIAKYNTNGDLEWVERPVGNFSDFGYSIATDGNGNAYVTGYFSSAAVLFGTTNLTNTGGGGHDIFIVKYDTNGNVVWGRSVWGNSFDYGNSITVDALGNIIVAGSFMSDISFDFFNLTSGVMQSEMFVAKMDTTLSASTFEIQNSHPEITITPNPFYSQTTITFNEEQRNTILKITDILGKEIKTMKVSGKQAIIEMEEMKAGIYFAKIQTEKGRVVKKIMKE